MVFSLGNLLRNLAHMSETDPSSFAANFARMALPNNNQGTDHQDDSSGDVLARLLSQVTGQRYEVQSDANRNTSASSTSVNSAKAAPLASTGDVSRVTETGRANADAMSHQQQKPLWPIFTQAKHTTVKGSTQKERSQLKEKEDDVNDDSSFVSCTSQPQADNLSDYPFCQRFPNDTVSFAVSSPSFRTSWSMVTYGTSKCNGTTHFYQSCLGIYRCPVHGCNFKRNAAIPRKKRVRFRCPDKPAGKQVTCRIHGTPLVHQQCYALVRLSRSPNGTTTVEHSGHHSHPLPHENKVSEQAKNWLKQVVETAPELKPHQIKKGNPATGRSPAREVHSALGNTDRLAHLRKEMLNKVGGAKFTLQGLPKWEELTGEKFLVAADISGRDGIISIQFPEMRNITKKIGGTLPLEDGEDTNLYAFQTDTIEKIINDDDYPSMGVTGTTAYSSDLKKYVPVLLSVTFARTHLNYERHFRLLLEGIEYNGLEEFMTKFPGNICDFSDAEKRGFELALQNLFSVKQDDLVDFEVPDNQEGLSMDDSVCLTGRGIQNESSYCYIISAIQVLFTFRAEFVIPLHDFFVRHKAKLGEHTLTYQLLALAAACFSSKTTGVPTTTNLQEVMRTKFPKEFGTAEHHDCSLFMSHLLAALNEELKKVAGTAETVPTDVFKFQQVTTYLCHSCNQSSDGVSNASREDHNFVLSVTCVGSDANKMSMRQLLDAYTVESEAIFTRKEKCPCCKKKDQTATRHTKVVAMPQVLIVLLGRNTLDQKLLTQCKLPNNLTSFDFQTIVAHPNIHENHDEDPETEDYRLAAVIRHHGNESTGGHFTVFANRVEDNWSVFDDLTVGPQTEEDGLDFTERNWRCAAYTSSNNTAESIEFDDEFLVGRNNGPQRFKLQNSYMGCKVHWLRSVERVRSNHVLVPPDEISQRKFQHMVNILASDKTTAERFQQTILELKEEFPYLTDWIDWWLNNNRGNCFFPCMTEGGIRGFGNNTNAQEGGGRWLQDAIGKKKAPLIEVLQHLYSAGKAVHQDVIAARGGQLSAYQRRRTELTPIERDEERKQKKAKNRAAAAKKRKKAEMHKNDGRPPDTTKELYTPPAKKRKRTPKKPPGTYNLQDFAMPWSYNIDGIRVTNTCAMDSFLQLLFFMRKYGVIGQHLFHQDKVLTEVLNDIDARQFHVARHKWVHHVMQACAENPDVVGKTWSLFGTTCQHSISCKLFQMKVRYCFDSCSINGICPNESSYESTNEDSMASMTHSITCLDIEGIFGGGARYDSLQDLFNSEFHTFNKRRRNGSVRRGEPCGTSINLFGRKQGCSGNRKSRLKIVEAPNILELYIFADFNDMWSSPSEIPQSFHLCGREYDFCGALLNDSSHSHFRALAKIDGKFAMYDGMGLGRGAKNNIKWIGKDERFGQGFSAGKVWYIQHKGQQSTEVLELSHDVKVGIPDGISVRSTIKNHTRHELVCQHCKVGQHYGVPLITLKEEAGEGRKNASYYHFDECCINEKIKSKSLDVQAAIEASDFPKEGQEMLREKFDSLLDNLGTDDEDDGGDDDDGGGGGGDSVTEKEKDDDSGSESGDNDEMSSSSSSSSSLSNAVKRYSLHVGDKIRYRPYFSALNKNKQFVEGIVTDIISKGILGYPEVRTNAEGLTCTLDYEDWAHFQLIHSDHDDAPPVGRGTNLRRVNLVEGKLEETRKRLADEIIQNTPGGVETQALASSVRSAKKQKLPSRPHPHTTRSVAKKRGIQIEGLFENEKK